MRSVDNPHSPSAAPVLLSRGLILLMAAACGITVANLYYGQPMLADMGRDFGAESEGMGIVQMLTQIGYAAGIFLFAPLGDIRGKRRLIVLLNLAVGLASLAAAAAQSLTWLAIASFAVGFTSIATQILIPMAAQYASPPERGKTVGVLLSGLLIGIMVSRIVAGFVNQTIGWRAMFAIAGGAMLLLAYVLQRRLPPGPPETRLSYAGLYASMASLIRELPALREASLVCACLFASLSVFWTGLPYFLESPDYALGSAATGLFGLVGVAGAAAAPVIGRLTDRVGARGIVGVMIGVALLAYLVLGTAGFALAGLIAGALLLDFGLQGGQVTNQTRIYSMRPEARSRLNTVLMVSSFIGGSLGASIGGYAWSAQGWNGTCFIGGGLVVLALIVWAFYGRRRYLPDR